MGLLLHEVEILLVFEGFIEADDHGMIELP